MLSEVFAYNPLNRLQRFALVEIPPSHPGSFARLELFELPAEIKDIFGMASLSTDTAMEAVRTYMTTQDLDPVLTNLDDMMSSVTMECPGPGLRHHLQLCPLTPVTWHTPLTVISGTPMNQYKARQDLALGFVGLSTVGVLKTSWSLSRGSTPPPFTTMDNRRRATQSATLYQKALITALPEPANSAVLLSYVSSDTDMDLDEPADISWPSPPINNTVFPGSAAFNTVFPSSSAPAPAPAQSHVDTPTPSASPSRRTRKLFKNPVKPGSRYRN